MPTLSLEPDDTQIRSAFMELTKSHELQIVEFANKNGIDPKDVKFFVEEREIEKSLFERIIDFLSSFRKSSTENQQPQENEIVEPLSYTRIEIGEYYFVMKSSRLQRLYSKGRSHQRIEIFIEYSPDTDLVKRNVKTSYLDWNQYRWQHQFLRIREWLAAVGDELKAIYKLNNMVSIPKSIFDSQSDQERYTYSDHDFFSDTEKDQLKSGINRVKQKIRSDYQLESDEITVISQKLDELIEKVDKLNKFDFRSAFYGVMINIASSFLYDYASTFLSTIMEVFNFKMIE